MKTHSILLLAALAMVSCISEGRLTEQPGALMRYQENPTEAKLLEVAKSYATAINDNLDNNVVHPGLYAEYGVALARLGCRKEASVMFNNEMMLFPANQRYIMLLKESLTPDYLQNVMTDTTHIDLATLDTIPITYTPEEQTQREQLFNDPEYQKQLKEQLKQDREQEALEKKQARKEQEKLKKEERKAKEKARKAEQKAKEKARKEQQKAKEEALEAERKAKEEAREAERKTKEEAREAERKAKEDAREAERKAKEMEK